MILRTKTRRSTTDSNVAEGDVTVRPGASDPRRSDAPVSTSSAATRPRRGQRGWKALTTLCLAWTTVVLAAGSAYARTEVLRWTHPDTSNLSRFEALVGTNSGNYGSPIPLGLPTPDGAGVFTASITVGDNDDVYVAIQAVANDGVASFPSNERFRPSPNSGGTTGGTTGGGTGGSGGSTGGGSSSLADGTEIPPAANATLRADFDSGASTGWVDTGADNSLSTDDSLFTVVNVGSNPALSTTSSLTNIHSHYVGSPSSMNNLIFTGRMATDAGGGGVVRPK